MGQMLIFFFATYAVDKMGSPPEVAAVILPFSSPFAMIARAAQVDTLWPHLLAIAWQMLDRKSVVLGKSVSVLVDLGGRGIIKKKTKNKQSNTSPTTHTKL